LFEGAPAAPPRPVADVAMPDRPATAPGPGTGAAAMYLDALFTGAAEPLEPDDALGVTAPLTAPGHVAEAQRPLLARRPGQRYTGEYGREDDDYGLEAARADRVTPRRGGTRARPRPARRGPHRPAALTPRPPRGQYHPCGSHDSTTPEVGHAAPRIATARGGRGPPRSDTGPGTDRGRRGRPARAGRRPATHRRVLRPRDLRGRGRRPGR